MTEHTATPNADHASRAVDPHAYRVTMGLFATGVTVITTRHGDIVHGMTANAVTSVSLEPTLLLVCVDRRARLHDLLIRAGVFAVNILAEDQEELSNHFAGRSKDGPPPASLQFDHHADGGAPTIAGVVAALRCTVEQAYPGGDHTILLGRVVDLRPGASDARPLLFFGGRYRRLADLAVSPSPAPDPWWHGSARLYYPEWEPTGEPEDYPWH